MSRPRCVTSSLLALPLALFGLWAFASEVTTFDLVDGSSLKGTVVSFTGGVYTVDTGTLGTVRLPEVKIRSMHVGSQGSSIPSPAAVPAPSGSLSSEVDALQKRMLSDPAMVQDILALAQSPDFTDALTDPAMLAAVQAGDVATLLKNPKFLRLLENKKLHDIERKITP